MKKRYFHKQYLIIAGLFPSLFLSQANTTESLSIYGFYSYYNSLLGVNSTTNPELTVKNDASFLSNGVELTPSTTSKFGGLLIDGRTFKSVNGIHVEFEYEMNGGATFDGEYGDGLGFFLYDGVILSPTLGARGAGLGYAYNRANDSYASNRAAGLQGGYLGIFLDQYGNSKGMRYQGDSRVNGIAGTWSNYSSHVTLRGAKGAALTTSPTIPNGYTGYPVLITRSTSGTSGIIGKSLQANRAYLDITSPVSSPFTLRQPTGGYRKVFLDLVPHATSSTTTDGFDIKLDIKTSTSGSLINVINWYHYSTSVPYTENAMSSSNNDSDTSLATSPTSADRALTLNASVPSTVKLGFAASTGAASQQHLIKKVKLTLPYAAEANDDTAQTCKMTPVTIPVLNNDIAYRGIINIVTPPVGGNSSSYIDFSMLSFAKSSDIDTTVYRTKSTSEGTWSYDTTTGMVKFTPNANFTTTGVATMTYTIKGITKTDTSGNITEPFGDMAYRSTPATITVTLKTTGCISTVISNKMVTQGVK